MAKAMREQGYNTSKIQREVLKTLKADKEYKTAIAQNTKAYKHEINRIIKETVREAGLAGDKLVGSAGTMAWNDDLRVWKAHNIDLKKPNNLNQLYQAFKLQTKNQLKNITQTTGFKGTLLGTTGVLNMYQRSMDLAVLKLSTGTFSYEQCVKDLIHQLSQSGLRTIDYANGRTYHIDTAARMVVRTASSQLAGKITEMNIEKTGVELVYVDAHAGARPSHADWQGQVYSYKGSSKKYDDFYSATDYGSVTGLKGVNCTHNFYPYWEGSPIPEFKEPDPVDVNGKEYTMYEATQEQRKMERGIRATKREIAAREAVGYDTKDLKSKLNKQTRDYKQFSHDVNIKSNNNKITIVDTTNNFLGVASDLDGPKAKLDLTQSFKIDSLGYSEKINSIISEKSREMVQYTYDNDYEYGCIIDLKNETSTRIFTSNDSRYVDIPKDIRKECENLESFVLLHTHVTESDASFGDYLSVVGYDNMDSIIAARPDGVMTAIQGKAIDKHYPFEFEDYFNEGLNKGLNAEKAEYYARDKLMLENGLGEIKTNG